MLNYGVFATTSLAHEVHSVYSMRVCQGLQGQDKEKRPVRDNRRRSVMKIEKYTFEGTEIGTEAAFEMPAGAEFVSAGIGPSGVAVYMMENGDTEKTKRSFLLTGSRRELPLGFKYLQTVQAAGYTWHVGEILQCN